MLWKMPSAIHVPATFPWVALSHQGDKPSQSWVGVGMEAEPPLATL